MKGGWREKGREQEGGRGKEREGRRKGSVRESKEKARGNGRGREVLITDLL